MPIRSKLAWLLASGLLAPLLASGHAAPVSYSPDPAVPLESPAAEVVIRFSERIEPGASSINVFGPDGGRSNENRGSVDPEDPRVFRTDLRPAGEGTYAVSWQVVSADDGHFTKGAFSFAVGAATPGAPAGEEPVQVLHSSAWPEAASIGLELFAQALLLGALAALIAWRKLRSSFPALSAREEDFRRGLGRFVLAGVVMLVAAGVLYFGLRALELGRGNGLPLAENLRLFADTAAGRFTLYRMLAALAFGTVYLAYRRRIPDMSRLTGPEILLYLLLGAMAFTRARVSHAAASLFLPEFSVFVNWVHVIFKELWIGSAASFAWLYFLVRPAGADAVKAALAKMSRAAALAVGMGGVTGAYIVWLHLKDPSNISGTLWGSRFVALTVLAAVFLGVRLYHQFLCREPKPGLRFSLPLEAALGAAVIFTSALLIITTPPLSPGERFERTAVSGDTHLIFGEHPSRDGVFLLQAHTGARITEAILTLHQEDRGIGPIVVPLERDPLGYAFPASSFSPPGRWRAEAVIRKSSGYDSNSVFRIDYPRDVQAPPETGREWNSFSDLSLLAAILLIGSSVFLYRRA